MRRRKVIESMLGFIASFPSQAAQEKLGAATEPIPISLEAVDKLEVYAEKAETANRDGFPALLLNGLLLVPGIFLQDTGLEVEILAEGACYPGILFRAADQNNFELAYAAPHLSGQADTVQYDPVFLGSNTWQIYNGLRYQATAKAAVGAWFRFRTDIVGDKVFVRLGDSPPLIVEKPAHSKRRGRVGLWSYRPAYFRNFRILPAREIAFSAKKEIPLPKGTVMEWGLEGYGAVYCEANGVLNLNRVLSMARSTANLIRRFEADKGTELELRFGFSDELLLRLNEEILFSGANKFKGIDSLQDRGWILPEANKVTKKLGKGFYELTALLKVSEPFGWGLTMRVLGEGVRWLPATSR